jgi:hypothetical protein
VIVIEINCNKSANKSSHPIQNSLLFITEPQICDIIIRNSLSSIFNIRWERNLIKKEDLTTDLHIQTSGRHRYIYEVSNFITGIRNFSCIDI